MGQADAMKKILLQPERLNAMKADPSKIAEEVNKATGEAKEQVPSTPIYLMMAGFLGAVAIISLLGAIGLVGAGKTIPEILVALGSAAVGGLAGALTLQKQQ